MNAGMEPQRREGGDRSGRPDRDESSKRFRMENPHGMVGFTHNHFMGK